MMWLFAILSVLLLGGVAVVAAGMGTPPAVPADRPIGPEDLRRVRFSVALRGYRMSEVDALLARLADEQAARAEARGATGEE